MILSIPFWALPAQAAETERDTIRIAIPTPFSTGDGASGSSAYIDYAMGYLREIAQYTGWEYEVIQVPGTYEEGIQTALDMLCKGTADMVAPVQYRQNTQNGVYFSQHSYVTESTVLQIPNKVYQGQEIGEDLRVAVIQGSGMDTSAEPFFAKNGITAEYVFCQSIEEQTEAVCSGRADVMLNSNLENVPNVSVVAEFLPQSLYFAAADQALLQELDNAIIYIRQANALFSMELYKENIMDSNQELTREESAFIEQQSAPYVVAVLEGNAPYQYQDPETGELRGIGVDILKRVAQETGLDFSFVSVKSWDALSDMLQAQQVQIVAGMPYDYDFAMGRELTVTRSYASAPYVLLAKEGFDGPRSGQQLALVEVNAYTEGNYVGEVNHYPTIADCVAAVRSGETDYTYVDLYTAQYYLGDARYSGLRMTPQSYSPRTLCFGLAKPTPHELISILNKAINQLSDTDTQNIITWNVNPTRDVTMMDVIIRNPMQALLTIGVISVFLAGFLTYLLWRKERVSKVLRRKAMEDGLTHLYNAAACRKLVSQKLRQRKAEQVSAFLIMDMDHFKEINDNHGHQTGDLALQSFANLLRDVLRGDSIVARIGGDEFVVYLHAIKEKENILSIGERIRSQAHSISIGGKPLTVSIGAVAVQEKDTYDTLYHLADEALYQAKHNQRDQFCLSQRGEGVGET